MRERKGTINMKREGESVREKKREKDGDRVIGIQ